MRRWKSSALLVAVAAVSLAQTSSTLPTEAVRRAGEKLACLCGTCKNTVGSCPMLQCHYASPVREKIAKLQALGMSDDSIAETVVKETGLQALSSPPASGFNLLAWVMPFIAIAMGLGVIYWFMRRPKLAPLPAVDAAVMDRYHDRIEKDLAKLDQ
jgi:cytochrome c-type biogenesis protein CcmH